ncbi:putative disease resistance RPP13-like protein 1 [Rhododendron vialii]|uniref:putative disease resistance RPP13-like protein 1 n=1 Tax=Rhododendron vialii TaxID=182163 RepID=UPI00265DD3DE|nr:putative disease resistance RPP13-like protein 1 [Rhododendron vialii]
MAIGEIFLTAFIQVLFEKLASRDLLNFARRERIDSLLTKWRSMLEQIGSVLADAEEKQMTDQPGIKPWLEELEDLAYDLDDVLDEFATEALRRKVMEEPRASTSTVRALVPTCCMNFKPSTIVSGFRMRSQIDEITARLQDLFDRRAGLGLQIVVVGPSAKTSQRPQTSSLIHEPRLYGRDEDKKAILELLQCGQSSNEKVGIVPIVGMGGVGKTTLAQDVYNDKTVGEHFEMKAWVCVSEVFDIVGVTKTILESVTSQTCHFNTLDQVQNQLKNAVTGKKFLIVLDDVWNEKHGDWISLKSPFNDGALGSKVIVTTRNRDVASMMAGIDKFHLLKELSEDDCWSVFAQHAFENRSIDKSSNLVSIGRKIVKKCDGLPLAARTLGGLLRCKVRDDEWEEVLNSKMWEFSDKKSDILPALRLSYYHLPSHLKKCFGYCSVLPKDYKFEEKELVFLWMAEGLIQKPMGQKQMEDLGSDYFCELSSRSFFQPSSCGEVSRFVMHDLINDLAQFVARRICFRMEEKLENNEGHTIITKARHSSFVRGYLDGKQKFEIFQKAKNLRSFLPFGLRDDDSNLTSDVPLQLLPRLRRLRVLSLRRYQIGELSSSIGDLKHLRFLDLTRALIATLPESVSTLYNLQTLILIYCINLSKLPTNMSNLINLRHLDVMGADSLQEMPQKIGKLTSLQTLSNFIVSQGNGSTINELGSLIQLRGTLCISGLENVENDMDARRANLKDKQHLDVLLMKWSNISDNSRNTSVDLEVLDMLRPHEKLKELTINGYRGLTFPTWVGNSLFSNMVNLEFQNCDKCISLPPLGRLPSLTKLYIQGTKALQNVGLEFYGSGSSNPFPALEFLTFEDMAEWKDWSPFEVEKGSQAFSRLSKLTIKRCPKLLGKLPNNLPSLRKLDIEDCPLLVVAWVPSPTGLIEVRNTRQFDSLISLSLKDVSIPNSFNNPEVGNEAAATENARYSPFSSLTSLGIKNIQGLTCLPSWFVQGLTRLQELSLYGCPELTSLWKNEVRIHHHLLTLRRLVIEGCPKLISLFEEDEDEEGLQQHEELPYMMLLEYLKIKNCKKMEKLPRGLHNLRSLQVLIIDACPCIISFPKTGLPSTLRTLHIESCDALRSLPELMMLNSLEKLDVWNCPSLMYLSGLRTGLPRNLRKMYILECAKLESVLVEEGMKIYCPSLKSFVIRGCDSLKSLPDVTQNNVDGGCLKDLSNLGVAFCENVESIPQGWFTATNLRELRVKGCKKLKGLPHHAYKNLTSLQSLTISRFDAATELISSHFTNLSFLVLDNVDKGGNKPPSEWGLNRLFSLDTLFLRGYGWASFPPVEEEEDGMMWLPHSLIELRIWDFPNLGKLSCKEFPSLERLRIWDCPNLTTITKLGLIPLLSELQIWNCPKLASFSAEEQGLRQLPPSLLSLEILECPILSERCEKKKKGQYWPFISYIPQVKIDYRNVLDPSS